MKAVNWNTPDDPFTKAFWDQNVRQFWVDEEIPLADDKLTWTTLEPAERETYEKVLVGLTLLDTLQGGVGMPLLAQAMESQQVRAVLSFMGAMEHMHAKSYSSIFSTLSPLPRIEALFRWAQDHPLLQAKVARIEGRYRGIVAARGEHRVNANLYLALASSVLLESYLFYSGFYYPLFLAGGGRLVNSGEIISLILRDEAIHGVYVGMLAQQVYARLPEEEQARLRTALREDLEELSALEDAYTEELYTPIGQVEEVRRFCRYNADKALMNLGQPPYFAVEAEEVNPVVLAGISLRTKNHDFFSTKGNGYVKALRVEPLRDEDFVFGVAEVEG